MPLHRYGVLKGRAVDRKIEGGIDTPHYQIHVSDGETDYRVSVCTRSQQRPPDLLYLVRDPFQHPLTAELENMQPGFTRLPSRRGGQALDYIRGNLFSRFSMRPLPSYAPGPDNDLSDQIEHFVRRAIADEHAEIYAFGERWGPEEHLPDKIFGFLPGNGVHDVHMNQGNSRWFARDNGIWQDGGLYFHFPATDQWVAVFLAFQAQAWHTDSPTGLTSRLIDQPGPAASPSESEPDHAVRIVGALVNPLGQDEGYETVTLLNASPVPIDLSGWTIADRFNNQQPLTGIVKPGETIRVQLTQVVELGNKGGIITLLNDRGLKVDGVYYTQGRAKKDGWTIVF